MGGARRQVHRLGEPPVGLEPVVGLLAQVRDRVRGEERGVRPACESPPRRRPSRRSRRTPRACDPSAGSAQAQLGQSNPSAWFIFSRVRTSAPSPSRPARTAWTPRCRACQPPTSPARRPSLPAHLAPAVPHTVYNNLIPSRQPGPGRLARHPKSRIPRQRITTWFPDAFRWHQPEPSAAAGHREDLDGARANAPCPAGIGHHASAWASWLIELAPRLAGVATGTPPGGSGASDTSTQSSTRRGRSSRGRAARGPRSAPGPAR